MAQIETGAALKLSGEGIYRGKSTANGILQLHHTNDYTTGYSGIVPSAKAYDASNAKGGSATANLIPFGYGVWYKDSKKSTKITNAGTGLAFAGILTRQAYIKDSFTNVNEGVSDWNKGLLCKQGYVNYKALADSKVAKASLKDVAFGEIAVGDFFGVLVESGYPVHVPATEVGAAVGEEVTPTIGDVLIVGRIVEKNFEDYSVTVKLG